MRRFEVVSGRGRWRGLLPQRKRFPVGGDAHAAKDEWRCRPEQGMAAVLPFGFRPDDAQAVGAERKNRERRRVGEARLTVETFDERRELWCGTELSGKIPVATIGRSLSGGVTGRELYQIAPAKTSGQICNRHKGCHLSIEKVSGQGRRRNLPA